MQVDLHCTASDNEKHFKIGRERLVQVLLEENPSTGYLWERADKNEEYVEVIQEDFYLEGPKDFIGNGGVKEYILRTKQAGETSFSFKNKRPWMPDDDHMGYFQLSLTIE